MTNFHPTGPRRRQVGALAGAWALGGVLPRARAADALPLFDAHIHYSHDAWELVPPKQAVAILRKAGLKGALVSSSNDEGTQKLIAEAPDLIVAELRPYRTRSDIGTWVRDRGTLTMEEAIHKLTQVQADLFGFTDRDFALLGYTQRGPYMEFGLKFDERLFNKKEEEQPQQEPPSR